MTRNFMRVLFLVIFPAIRKYIYCRKRFARKNLPRVNISRSKKFSTEKSCLFIYNLSHSFRKKPTNGRIDKDDASADNEITSDRSSEQSVTADTIVIE